MDFKLFQEVGLLFTHRNYQSRVSEIFIYFELRKVDANRLQEIST